MSSFARPRGGRIKGNSSIYVQVQGRSGIQKALGKGLEP